MSANPWYGSLLLKIIYEAFWTKLHNKECPDGPYKEFQDLKSQWELYNTAASMTNTCLALILSACLLWGPALTYPNPWYQGGKFNK